MLTGVVFVAAMIAAIFLITYLLEYFTGPNLDPDDQPPDGPTPHLLDLDSGPTIPFPAHPGHPRRWRRGRLYRRTGKGFAEPFRRRPRNESGAAHRVAGRNQKRRDR